MVHGVVACNYYVNPLRLHKEELEGQSDLERALRNPG
jgi:hypothetical protein